MFMARRTPHSLSVPIVKYDEYNEKVLEYAAKGTVDIYIVQSSINVMNQESLELKLTQFIGFTNQELPEGSIIDGRYKVEYQQPSRYSLITYLSSTTGLGD